MKSLFFFAIFSAATVNAAIAQGKLYEIDLRSTQTQTSSVSIRNIPPQISPVSIGMTGTNPSGETLSVNSSYFEKNGKPWFPLMGEMHFNRVRPEDWEQEIMKLKSAGLSIVATYIFWNEHERSRNIWDWEGNRNLRRFIELCTKNGMYVWLRIGPWSHGEQLNGGYPDWIQMMKGRRTNDPAYLEEAKKLFHQIGMQTSGLFFGDGGPVIGVQLENEYASGQAEHISALKKLALAAAIHPVYWSVTANTIFDDTKNEVIPLQGSYPYRGWESGGGKATKDFLYGNDQWIMTDALGKMFYDIAKFPRGLCEQGCGSQLTYQNRFVVAPEVVEAHLQNQIGRGMNLIGYYMFHGGTQTPGLKEPGCPESYDFQAPVSEFGLLRPSYRYLKILHSFVKDFGSELAQMAVFEPDNPVRDELNSKDIRYIARANGGSGFLFLCNTQVRVTMPDKTVRMQVNLPDERINFPTILVKGQTTAILPFNVKAGASVIKYVTAQPFARIVHGNKTTLFFQELPGVRPQVALDAKTVKIKNFKGWLSRVENNQLLLKAIGKASNAIGNVGKAISNADTTIGNADTTFGRTDITYSDINDGTVTLVFLTRHDAENAWRIKLKNQEALLITDADVLADSNKITLQQINNNVFKWQIYPALLNAFANSKPNNLIKSIFDNYQFTDRPYLPQVLVKYPQRQTALISYHPGLPDNVSDIIINVDYFGGACKLFQMGNLLTDNLFNGTTWQIGLHRYIGNGDISLHIEDWNVETTGLPGPLVNSIKTNGSNFKSIKALPQYQTVLHLNN